MNCEGFLGQVHFRLELPALEREAFAAHAESCASCAQLLKEIETLEDVWLGWEAPPCPSFVPAVMSTLGAEDTGVSSADSEESPAVPEWLEAEPWQSWQAPAPPADLASRVIEQIRTERLAEASSAPGGGDASLRSSPPRPSLRRWLDGPIHISRLAAALLVTATLLGVATGVRGLFPDSTPRPAGSGPVLDVTEAIPLHPIPPPTVYVNAGGAADRRGTESLVHQPGRGVSLRRAAYRVQSEE